MKELEMGVSFGVQKMGVGLISKCARKRYYSIVPLGRRLKKYINKEISLCSEGRLKIGSELCWTS